MNTRQFIKNFTKSEFYGKNVFCCLQPGLPLPIRYKDGLAIVLFLHKITYGQDCISMSAPKFAVNLVYPCARITRFEELPTEKFEKQEIVIPNRKMNIFKSSFESCYLSCDEILQFYDGHNSVTQVLFKRHYEGLKRITEDIGLEAWYGGFEC